MQLLHRKLKWILMGLSAAALTACGGGDDPGAPPAGKAAASSSFVAKTLVSDVAANATIDPKLVNAWGVAFNPTGDAWVANAGTSTATMYNGNGQPLPLVVSIPTGIAGLASPTGIVHNGTPDFVVGQPGASGPGIFLFVGEAGTLSGWSPGVNPTSALKVFDGAAAGAVYKGLALANSNGSNFLYATDFHNARVDVFDAKFARVTMPGGFTDPTLPAGFAPFGIQEIGGSVYVAFAKQDSAAHDHVASTGMGLVDVFDTTGHFIRRFVDTGGSLNAPWGMAQAPANLGSFSNALLVGNAGDGKINAFDATTGASIGTLIDSTGTPIVIDGLRGIGFGNGVNSQPTNTLFFAGGPSLASHGVYGRIDLN